MAKKSADNYSLSLFGGTPSTDIFKKPVQASQMIVQNAVMTGQQLLAWNILVKNAKEQKELRTKLQKQNGPIEQTYKISRVELMDRMGYLSTNRKPFKQALLKMQELRATWDVLGSDNTKWASCVLLPFVQCDEEFVTYSFVNHIEPMLFESSLYSKIDLVIQKNLKLDASKKLYDWLARYRTNPSQLSNKAEWTFWKTIVHGAVDESSYTREYKIFKRDKLKPAINEINEISDLQIELIEDKEGTRSVKNLQFRVKEKPKFSTETEEKIAIKEVKVDIHKELSKLNISTYYKKKLLQQFPEQIILNNLEYTLNRLKKDPDLIKNHGAYLVAACEANYAGELKQAAVPTANKGNDQTSEILNMIQQDRNKAAGEMFNEMDIDQQSELVTEYNIAAQFDEQKIPEEIGKRTNRHMIPFFTWLADKTWGPPTPVEIVEYTLRLQNKKNT